MTLVNLPSHAYVPGLNARHEDGAFAALRGTAQPGMATETLANCAAFHAGLLFIAQGFYWEAHEVLEAVWLALPPASSERQFVQALIQFANARLKQRMGRDRAAARLIDIAARHLAEAALCGRPALMGEALAHWRDQLVQVQNDLIEYAT